MSRYAEYLPGDNVEDVNGDVAFSHVDMKTPPAELPNGVLSEGRNVRMDSASIRPRGGTIEPVHANIETLGTLYGSGLFSDPNNSSEEWIILAAADGVWMVREGRYPNKRGLQTGQTISDLVTFVQCFSTVVMLRGEDLVPLAWNGSFTSRYNLITRSVGGDGTEEIPNSIVGRLFKNRLVVKSSRDSLAVSDAGDYTRYDPVMEDFTFNEGSDDEITGFDLYEESTLAVFKDQSIYGVANVYGDLSDIRGLEVDRSGIGLCSQSAIQRWGSKLMFMHKDSGIWSIDAADNASGKIYLSEWPISDDIEPLINRINWKYADKIVSCQLGNYIYWFVPLDGVAYNNVALVFNRRKGRWEGYDIWDDAIGMRIDNVHVTDWLGTKAIYGVDFASGKVRLLYVDNEDVISGTHYGITMKAYTRGYRVDSREFLKTRRVYVDIRSQNPRLTVELKVQGVNRSETLISQRTKDRTKYYTWGKAAFNITDPSNTFSDPSRQDYLLRSNDGVPSNNGVQNNLKQESTEGNKARSNGRFGQVVITNDQWYCEVMGVRLGGQETRRSEKTKA
jgi:hypothetical protein